MFLFFDTETDGLPETYQAPTEDVNNWPRVVQLAWALYSENRYLVASASNIVFQNDKLSEEVIKIHGIDDSMVKRYGIGLHDILNDFRYACGDAEYLIAHNIYFDRKVLGAEYIRREREIPFLELNRICTMNKSTSYCALPGKRGYKWPKLEELYKKLFDEEIDGAHNAMIDVFATAKCFFKLLDLNVISLEKEKV